VNSRADCRIARVRACANAITIDAAASPYGTDMRAGMNTAVADTGARRNHTAGMAACFDTMLVDAGTCANVTHMGTRADAILAADMGADADTQDIDTYSDAVGISGGTKQGGEGETGRREQDLHMILLHGINL